MRLYDLGRSLRLAGDPRQAVQVLYQRLQIPNQTGVVRQELQLALVALGQQTSGRASGPPARRGRTAIPTSCLEAVRQPARDLGPPRAVPGGGNDQGD